MYSYLIKNCLLYDGVGESPHNCDIALSDGQIVNIAKSLDAKAKDVIDAAGRMVAPGFIDLQNHSDSYWQLFDNRPLEGLIRQGYTTLLVGNCGASLAPLLSEYSLMSIQKWHSLEATNINWSSFSEYIAELQKNKFGCNIASLVGYGTLRRGLVGDEVRALRTEELNSLQKILYQSIKDGAFGLSSGLSYAHEIAAPLSELKAMAKTVRDLDGLFSVHLRSEGEQIMESIDEVLELARDTKVNLKISHLKIRGNKNWNKLEEVLHKIDIAYHKGVDVHFDVYPYSSVWQVLYAYLPKWAIEGGRNALVRHLSDKVQKNKILSYLHDSQTDFQSIIIASTSNKLNFTGKTIGQIAKNLECSSEEAVLHIIENGGSEILVFDRNLDPTQVDTFLSHPLSFVATDGAGFALTERNRLVHPRCFGSAPKYLKNNLDGNLGKAVKKLSSGPAKKLGLKNRGSIKIGNFADLVIVDSKKVSDKATYENPFQFSTGIDYVFVNGEMSIKEGQQTGKLAGSILKK